MGDATPLTRVHDLLREVFRDREQLTGREIRHRTAGMAVSSVLERLVEGLPDGDYDQDRAGAELRRIQQDEGIWRDESELPLADLDRAIATSGTEGQFDDRTGHDAGAGEMLGDEPLTGPAAPEGGAEPGSTEDRRVRPAPEGPSGPH